MKVYSSFRAAVSAYLDLKFLKLFTVICLTLPWAVAQSTSVRFAVIGDYGRAGKPELDVSNLVRSWNPEFIITTGDNNYEKGQTSTIDANIGQYYHDFIFPYQGKYGAGAAYNRFFPSLGNHDYETENAQPYLDYFTLPGNERYYDFVWGPVHFFALDSDPRSPDGTSSTSLQAQWLQKKLAASTARWKLVYFHHAPYTAGSAITSTTYMQWPFQQWGASIVLSGHAHDYERIVVNGFTYIVNGLGGHTLLKMRTPLVPGTAVAYDQDFGAMLAEADSQGMTFKFITRTGLLVDSFTLGAAAGISTGPFLQSVVNAASYVPGAIAPGELLSLFGAGLGPPAAISFAAGPTRLPATSLAGSRVLFDGAPAPLIFASATQINAIAPSALLGKTSTRVQVEVSGALSNPVDLPVSIVAPAIFTLDGSGTGPAAVLNQDYLVNTPISPASKGSIVMIFSTGGGPTFPSLPDFVNPTSVSMNLALPVSVSIGGQTAAVLFAGAAPGLVAGTVQINARIPTAAPSGQRVPLVVTVGDQLSQPHVSIAVQ